MPQKCRLPSIIVKNYTQLRNTHLCNGVTPPAPSSIDITLAHMGTTIAQLATLSDNFPAFLRFLYRRAAECWLFRALKKVEGL